jgi:hypothetical protein
MSLQNTAEETIVGGWTPYHKLTNEDQHVFDQAMKDFVGVKYTPLTVSTQLVAGMNYRFKCSATMPPAYVIWEAIVDIFKPLNGPPVITGIHRI